MQIRLGRFPSHLDGERDNDVQDRECYPKQNEDGTGLWWKGLRSSALSVQRVRFLRPAPAHGVPSYARGNFGLASGCWCFCRRCTNYRALALGCRHDSGSDLALVDCSDINGGCNRIDCGDRHWLYQQGCQAPLPAEEVIRDWTRRLGGCTTNCTAFCR